MPDRRLRPALGVLVLAFTCLTGPLQASGDGPSVFRPQQAKRGDLALLTVDLAAIDAAGRVPETLAPADVTVTVGGHVRTVAWVRRVSRGPGALADAAARRARSGASAFAEPHRMVLLIIDEVSLPMGGERFVIQSAAAFLDRLGIDDRVAVIRLPQSANAPPALNADRASHRDAVNRIAGRIAPDGIRTDGVTPDSSHVGGNPMGGRIAREEQADRPLPAAGDDTPASGGGLDGLTRVLESVVSLPGRKVVAFYSSGLDDRTSGAIARVVRASAKSRAALYVFGLPVPRDPRYSSFDPRLLGQLARAAGGVFVPLTRRPAEGLDTLAPELDACFQLGLEPGPDDPLEGVRELRVESRRKGLAIRAPGFVAFGAPAAPDVEPPAVPSRATTTPAPEPEAYRGAGRLTASPVPPGTTPSAMTFEAERIVGRLGDYARGYIGQYSAVVADEDYRQVLRTERQERRLRSDLLFVWSESVREWVSFRDVYEVDGKPVRDRDTRLQDLFLSPKPDGRAQLQAIKDESARFNIGPFERNINVPLYLLKVFSPAYRRGFSFSVGGSGESAGVKTWRLNYREHGRPTLVQDRNGADIPLEGYFLVDQATGAIVESAVTLERRDYGVSIVSRFERDPRMGLWLPVEMKETYTVPLQAGSLGVERATILSGTARYANFRRFQVTTDMQVAPKK